MQKFSDVLSTLDSVDHVKSIEIYDKTQQRIAVIENKSGTQGSLKLYQHLYKTYGEINTDAAVEGLELYAEYTQDAENHPGKHPNIDRLFEVLDSEKTLYIKIINA